MDQARRQEDLLLHTQGLVSPHLRQATSSAISSGSTKKSLDPTCDRRRRRCNTYCRRRRCDSPRPPVLSPLASRLLGPSRVRAGIAMTVRACSSQSCRIILLPHSSLYLHLPSIQSSKSIDAPSLRFFVPDWDRVRLGTTVLTVCH